METPAPHRDIHRADEGLDEKAAARTAAATGGALAAQGLVVVESAVDERGRTAYEAHGAASREAGAAEWDGFGIDDTIAGAAAGLVVAERAVGDREFALPALADSTTESDAGEDGALIVVAAAGLVVADRGVGDVEGTASIRDGTANALATEATTDVAVAASGHVANERTLL